MVHLRLCESVTVSLTSTAVPNIFLLSSSNELVVCVELSILQTANQSNYLAFSDNLMYIPVIQLGIQLSPPPKYYTKAPILVHGPVFMDSPLCFPALEPNA